MCLATATPEGKPSARMVLLKEFDARGFVFYTNLESRKGGELAANPNVAICFYWDGMDRQVRIEGSVTPVSDEEADAYYQSRGLKSRIGAWASKQSQVLESRGALLKRVAEAGLKVVAGKIERPPFWSGFRVAPVRMEFWQQGEARLHDRVCYTRAGAAWEQCLLYP